MTSDVVRWSQLCLQQNKLHHSDVMTPHKKSPNSRRYRINRETTNDSIGKRGDRSPIAATIGPHLHKTVLLFVWLVINQNVSLVLSEPILAASNLTIDDKHITGDELIHPLDVDELALNSMSLHDQKPQTHDGIEHQPNQYQSHQIIVDDDLFNDKHFTSTWAVHIPGGEKVADRVARHHGFTNLGKVS